jgi:hypothetical protein
MQRHVRYAVLLQLAESGRIDLATTVAMVPGANEANLTTALEHLLDEGSIERQTWRAEPLVELAVSGWMRLTALGRLRLDEDV